MKLFNTTLLPILALSVTAVSAFDRILTFADSFTDNGNDYRASKYPPSPYWKGRFSNGPTWLEYVSKDLAGIEVINNANGGATTNNADAYSVYNGFMVPGLQQKILTTYNNATADDLYLISIGYNDLNSLVNPTQYYIVDKDYTKEKVYENLVEAIQLLIDLYGANNFLIMPVPPFDHWPLVKTEDKPTAKKLIEDYNALVQSQLPKSLPDVTFKFLDSHAYLIKLLANPEKLVGQHTSNGPCFSGDPATPVCKDPKNHFFWDPYHPSKEVHAALGAWATKEIRSIYNIKSK